MNTQAKMQARRLFNIFCWSLFRMDSNQLRIKLNMSPDSGFGDLFGAVGSDAQAAMAQLDHDMGKWMQTQARPIPFELMAEQYRALAKPIREVLIQHCRKIGVDVVTGEILLDEAEE